MLKKFQPLFNLSVNGAPAVELPITLLVPGISEAELPGAISKMGLFEFLPNTAYPSLIEVRTSGTLYEDFTSSASTTPAIYRVGIFDRERYQPNSIFHTATFSLLRMSA